MVPSDMESELAKLDGMWKETAENGGIQLPDGNLTFRIESATVNRSQGGNGRLQVAMKLRVVAGEHAGKEVMNYQGLDNAQAIGFFKRYMSRLELACPESLTQLPAWVGPALTGVTFLGQVKNKEGFTNIYPQKRVTLDPTAPQGGQPPKLGM